MKDLKKEESKQWGGMSDAFYKEMGIPERDMPTSSFSSFYIIKPPSRAEYRC